MPSVSLQLQVKMQKLAAVVLQNTQNFFISRRCFAENGKGMYKDFYRTCTAIALLIKPFVWRRSRWGFVKLSSKKYLANIILNFLTEKKCCETFAFTVELL